MHARRIRGMHFDHSRKYIMTIDRLRSTLALLVLAVLAACGGGNDDPAPTLAAQTAVGTITGFGSVVVNGVRFDDRAARVTMDDALTTRDRLRVGMTVQVRGRIHADARRGRGDESKQARCSRRRRHVGPGQAGHRHGRGRKP